MLTLNDIFKLEQIDPKRVRLVRHHDTRHREPTLYELWRANDGRFETYQRIQKKRKFEKDDLLASFVVTPRRETLFVGLYTVGGIKKVPPGVIDPISGQDVAGKFFYDIHRDHQLADYTGHLIIDWGKGGISWVQHADRQNKAVLEIRKETTEPFFPGFAEFCCDLEQIKTIPSAWQEVLRSAKGVYLLVCKNTGKQYVGSAKGEENFWGRFLDYAETGHGGNIELKRQAHTSYQVTILEVVNSGYGIARIEEAWKKKLLSRKFGLNKN